MTTALGTNCASGYYSLGGQPTCTVCPQGSTCVDPTVSPVKCPDGQFQASTGQITCDPCNPGYACPIGSIRIDPPAAKCPKGYFCTDGKLVTECPKGTYGNMTGATTEAEGCADCPQGWYCPAALAGLPPNSLLCPRGHYCSGKTGDYKNSPCPAGKFLEGLGAVSSAECLDCPAGRSCAAGTADPQCQGCSCPKGHYCPRAITAPVACPAGTFTEEDGATGLEYCKSCPAGHYCISGVDTPTPCVPGTMNEIVGQTDVTACQPCTAGYVTPIIITWQVIFQSRQCRWLAILNMLTKKI